MLLPFQVFSCWNGIAIIDSSLFLPSPSLRFRSQGPTDAASECKLFCHDVWGAKAEEVDEDGRPKGARIMVVPRASVAYNVKDYETKREDRNTEWFEKEGWEVEDREVWESIKWEAEPPKEVVEYPYGESSTLDAQA